MSFESGVVNSFGTRGPPSGETQLLGSIVCGRCAKHAFAVSPGGYGRQQGSEYPMGPVDTRTICLRRRSSGKLRPVTSASASRSPCVSCTRPQRNSVG